MAELDIISVAEADSWLSLQLSDDDTQGKAELERLIKTAIAWVEKYTSYRLWQRTEVIQNSRCSQSVAAYPIAVASVKDDKGADVIFKTYSEFTKTRITCPFNSVITLTVGYDEPAAIPGPLIDACYKLITYLYENRDAYQAQLPSDIQMLLNQYRRALA